MPRDDSSTRKLSAASSQRKSSRGWVLASLLSAGCLATGLWALPQVEESRHLHQGATSSFSAPTPSFAPTPSVSSPLTAGALDQELNPIAEAFSAGNISGTVIDATSGEVLYSHRADDPRVPASNFKILTDYAVLRTFNPYDRFTTSVLQHGDTLTLQAGGDTLLGTGESDESKIVGHAGLGTLAQETIDSLKNEQNKEFVLNLDISMYSGPAINSAWAQEDIDAGFVNKMAPLAFYSHFTPGPDGQASQQRPTDPAHQVQQAFLADLNELGMGRGLSFTLGKDEKAPEDASVKASVQSATVSQQAAYMMRESDNMLAEVLGRNAAAHAGKDGSEESARQLIREVLTADGISTAGLHQSDLCGLSMDNKVSHQTLTEITRAMVTNKHGLSAGLDGFPVAGGSGTLTSRFDDPNEAAALGYSRGKTGTLNKVIALTGYTQRDNGQVLIYSFITNDVSDTEQAKDTIDRSVAIVTNQD